MTRPASFLGGGRFTVSVDATGELVTKRGNREPLRREAQALRRVGPTGLSPQLVGARPGELVTTRVHGRSRSLRRISEADAAALGAALRRVHDLRATQTGGRAEWASRVATHRAYASRRLADLGAIPGALADLHRRVARELQRLPAGVPPAFRFLHGDLVAANILWTPAPVLVDWEFWRAGDPAEDLAYLFELNALPATCQAAVLRGYGSREMGARVDRWRSFCLLDAGLWYRRHGDCARGERLIVNAARRAG